MSQNNYTTEEIAAELLKFEGSTIEFAKEVVKMAEISTTYIFISGIGILFCFLEIYLLSKEIKDLRTKLRLDGNRNSFGISN